MDNRVLLCFTVFFSPFFHEVKTLWQILIHCLFVFFLLTWGATGMYLLYIRRTRGSESNLFILVSPLVYFLFECITNPALIFSAKAHRHPRYITAISSNEIGFRGVRVRRVGLRYDFHLIWERNIKG